MTILLRGGVRQIALQLNKDDDRVKDAVKLMSIHFSKLETLIFRVAFCITFVYIIKK